MMQHRFNILLACTLLFTVVGCANRSATVKDEPKTATLKAEDTKPAATPAAPRGIVTNAIAAIVNDEVVTLYEVNRAAQPFIREAEKKAQLDDAVRSQIRRTALEQVVEKKLIEQKIRELNIKVTEEEIRQAIDDVKKQNSISTQEALVAALANQGLSFDQYRTQLQEQLEKLKLVSVEVRAKIHVSESELRDFYEANRSKYTEDDSYRARHIFFKTNEKASSEDIKRSMTNALMVLAETKSGKDFIELAKTYSEDPAARKDGGDLGVFKKGDMQPEMESAIVAMKPGEVSELVYTPSGFHIIKLEERISGKLKPYEGLKAELEEAVYRNKSEERFGQWAKDLRGKASIEIKDLKGLL